MNSEKSIEEIYKEVFALSNGSFYDFKSFKKIAHIRSLEAIGAHQSIKEELE